MAKKRKKFNRRRDIQATIEVININTRQRKIIDLEQKERIVYDEKWKTYEVITSGSATYDVDGTTQENIRASGSAEPEEDSLFCSPL